MKTKILFLMIVILICSCSLEDGEKPEQLIPFSVPMMYGVVEGYPDGENTEPQFWLLMNTIDNMKSPWFNISSDLDTDKDNVYVELLGIAQDLNFSSMTLERSAHGEEYFMIPNGDYSIRFYTKTDSMVHTFSITDSLIILPDQASTKFQSDPGLQKVHRYKENTMGIVFKGYNDKKWIVEALIDSLKSKHGFEDYKYGTNAVLPLNFADARYFLRYRNMPGTGFTAAVQYLEEFTQDVVMPNTVNVNELTIEIIDWKNERASSKDYYLDQ